jgi:hypothetical protein
MSQISFDDLIKQHPEYRRALKKLDEWLRGYPRSALIDPKSLARDLHGVNTADLAGALSLLVRVGILQRVYKVLTPSGVLAEGEFEDPTRIPQRIADRFNNYFDTAEADVVPIFKKVA